MSEYMPTVEDLVVAWTEVRLERSKRANAGECLAAARRAITAHDAELREEIAVEIETHLDALRINERSVTPPQTKGKLMTNRAPWCFIDTETLGLGLDDPIWEIAVIRDDPDEGVSEHSWLVRHDPEPWLVDVLPESFADDYRARYDERRALARRDTREKLCALFERNEHGRVIIFGSSPDFDTSRISRQLLDRATPWHHHLVDVPTLVAGGCGAEAKLPPSLDWACQIVGIDTDIPERHTALGDARLTRALLYRVIGAER